LDIIREDDWESTDFEGDAWKMAYYVAYTKAMFFTASVIESYWSGPTLKCRFKTTLAL
jgi:hypothetical protein